MEHLSSIISTVSVVVALGSGAFAGLRNGALKDLRDTNNDLRAEIADKERREAESKQLHEAAEVRIASLQTDYEALSKVVTGETHWVAIGEDIDAVRQAVAEIRNLLTSADDEKEARRS
jgi:hypothetical protein